MIYIFERRKKFYSHNITSINAILILGNSEKQYYEHKDLGYK